MLQDSADRGPIAGLRDVAVGRVGACCLGTWARQCAVCGVSSADFCVVSSSICHVLVVQALNTFPADQGVAY